VWIKFIDRQQRSASPAAGEGRNDSLVWLLAQAEERFVNDPDFLGFLADYYQARSMPQQSVRLYRKRLQLEPDHSVTLASYAISLLDAGETEQAIQLVPRLCAAKLDDWRHASKLIARLMKLKAFDSALPLARKIAQEYPEEPLTQFRLASCIYHHDGAEAARPLAERAASLDPTKQWTINLLQTIRCDLARKTG
jgi:tetratricopeptide (TPR) repeat protein